MITMKERPKYIKREAYLKKIRGFYDSDLIKIITGIRRCGKSVFLDNIMEEIGERSGKIVYVNFEDRISRNGIEDSSRLIEYVMDSSAGDKCYVFLDEIQMLPSWAEAVRTLRLHNASVFITGSNSSLLSSEFTKELSGRYVSFRIRPFVYREAAELCGLLGKGCSITDYMVWGGFPNRFSFDTTEEIAKYLEDLNETIVFKDIIGRYGIRKTDVFRRVCDYVFLSNSRIFSTKSIASYIRNDKTDCSINTIRNFIEYLKSAYAIETIPEYSSSVKRDLLYYFKLYDSDLSFNSLRRADGRYDLTHNFENAVYNELLFMGYELKVYSGAGDREIDFIASKGGKTFLVQAAYSIAESKAYEREFAPFRNMNNVFQKIIVTNDDLDYTTSTVRHIRFRDFVSLEGL
ncbi:MAG TPA: hypothetical protein DCO86_03930 [Spirochaetaceae bacterium]|nr:hypothetical protein [Spirochaetaceae bacterium]